MSIEPRLQLEDTGTIVGEVWKDSNDDLVLTENESGTEVRIGSSRLDIGSNSLTQGSNPAETISETTSPKGFDFVGDDGRDIHDQTVVTLTNGTTGSVSETITVELYDGTDTTGTLIASESRSVSVGAGSTTTATFITGDVSLNNGTYHVNVTQSGTTLSVDQTDEHTKGATYTFGQTNTGDLFLQNQDGLNPVTIDPVDDVVRTPDSGARIESNGVASSGSGLETTYDPNQPAGIIRTYDRTNAAFQETKIQGSELTLEARSGLIDASDYAANLRLASGQSIEDGGGTSRFELGSSWTRVFNDGGDLVFSSSDGAYAQIVGYSGQPIKLRDGEGAFDGVKYITSSTAPGTLELTNSQLFAQHGINLQNTTDLIFQGDSTNGNQEIRYYNSGTWNWSVYHDGSNINFRDKVNGINMLSVDQGGLLNASGSERMRLPTVSADPAAGAGDMWYRADLD